MKRFVFAAVLLCGPVIIVTACQKAPDTPQAAGGRLDLTHWDFDRMGSVALDGEWELYWKRFLNPPQKNTRPEPFDALIRVPGSWNEQNKLLNPTSDETGHGYATLNLNLALPVRSDLVLYNSWTASAFRLFCGERLLAETGKLADKPESNQPMNAATRVALDNCAPKNLIWQISNFHHHYGGPRNSWRLGTASAIAREVFYRDFLISGFIILAAFLGICFFLIWLIRTHDYQYLVFSLLGFASAAIRLGSEKILQRLFSANVFELQYKVEYAGIAISAMLILLSVCLILSPRRIKFLLLPMLAPGLFWVGYVSVTPVVVFSKTAPALMLYLLFAMTVSIFCTVVAVFRKKENSLLYLIGLLVMAGVACHDILVLRGVIPGPRFDALGFLGVVSAQVAITIRSILLMMRASETAGKKIRDELRNQISVSGRQNALLEAAANMWIINDPNDFGRIQDVSRSVCETLGYTREELLNMRISDIEVEFPVSTRAAWLAHLAELRALGGSQSIDGTWRCKDGRSFPVTISVSIQVFAEKEYLVGIGRDVTKYVESHMALKRSEEKFQEFYRNNPLMLFILRPDGTILGVNPAALQRLEYAEEELIGESVAKMLHPEDRERVLRSIQAFGRQESPGSPSEFRKQTKRGEILWVSETLQFMAGPDNDHTVLAICRDVSERIRTEEALRESEAHMRLITEAFPGPVSHIGRDGTYLYINRHYESWFGQPKQDIMGRAPRQILPPEVHEQVEKHFKIVRAGHQVAWETTIHTADGRHLAAEITHIPHINSSGEVQGIFTVVFNITERKKAEEELLRSLREKEMLLAEIHHRVKNNLQVISSLLSMQRHFITDSAALEQLDNLGLRIRAMGLLHNLLYKSRDIGKVEMKKYLVSIAEQVLSVQRPGTDKIDMLVDIEDIYLNIESALPIGLIVNEVISNALKYAFDKIEKPVITLQLKSRADCYLLHISDNGPGMTGPFDQGASLGFRLIQVLTKQLHGKLQVDSHQGMAFHIEFLEQKREERRWER